MSEAPGTHPLAPAERTEWALAVARFAEGLPTDAVHYARELLGDILAARGRHELLAYSAPAPPASEPTTEVAAMSEPNEPTTPPAPDEPNEPTPPAAPEPGDAGYVTPEGVEPVEDQPTQQGAPTPASSSSDAGTTEGATEG